MSQESKKARVIAFYLPQFHPIPENDLWWGKGFTEWTNVGKAKPLFKGHYQPRVPADLGYYDLRMPEVRTAQAEMAKDAGIEGFCYWHYWFGDGKRLLERPFNEVLNSGEPDFPFCLGWANHSWTSKSWTVGNSFVKDGLLMEQKYSVEDYILHFNSLLPAFLDKRYIKVDGKPLFVVFSPLSIPNIPLFIDTWTKLAKDNGLEGIHFSGIYQNFEVREEGQTGIKAYKLPNFKDAAKICYNKVLDAGFDSVNSRGITRAQMKTDSFWIYYFKRFLHVILKIKVLQKYKYEEIIKHLFVEEDRWENVFPTLIPNWDRSARSGKDAIIWHGSSPKLFKKQVEQLLEIIKDKPEDKKVIFLQSWNEWAEGNYVEPDIVYGKEYLEVLKKCLI